MKADLSVSAIAGQQCQGCRESAASVFATALGQYPAQGRVTIFDSVRCLGFRREAIFYGDYYTVELIGDAGIAGAIKLGNTEVITTAVNISVGGARL